MLTGIVEFARTKGAKDKEKRRRKRNLTIGTGAVIGTGSAVTAKGLDGVAELLDTSKYSDLYDNAPTGLGRYKRTVLEDQALLGRDFLRRKVELRTANLQKNRKLSEGVARKVAVPLTYVKDGFLPGMKSAVRNKGYLLGSAVVGGIIGDYLYRKRSKGNN